MNKKYWDNRYLSQEIGWDIGEISTPLKEYIDQLSNKNSRILIPGAGNSHEAEYLHKQGFKNITLLDISEFPLINFKKRNPSFPKENIVLGDFFELDNTFDLILEQTFFCALNPKRRKQYVLNMYDLLSKEGKLVGLLFNSTLNSDHPPYGGNVKEYKELFESKFQFKTIETAYNSIESRKGREVFINFIKK